MAPKKVARSNASQKQPTSSTLRSIKAAAPVAPAEALRQAKAKVDSVRHIDIPRLSDRKAHPASAAARIEGEARRELRDIIVPVTLGEVCSAIGCDCDAENFGSTALMTLAAQLDAVSGWAESDEHSSYDCYVVIANIVSRMKLASRVTRWLQSEKALAKLPEVAP